MLSDYGLVALFLVASTLLAIIILLLPVILRYLKVIPKKPSKVKSQTYECGMETEGRSWVQFNFRYYFYALLLIALDVMVIFLYPWAVEIKQLELFGFAVILVFIFITIIGYIYAWRKKVLEWQ